MPGLKVSEVAKNTLKSPGLVIMCTQNTIKTHHPEVTGSPAFAGTSESSPRYLATKRHLSCAFLLSVFGPGLLLVTHWTSELTGCCRGDPLSLRCKDASQPRVCALPRGICPAAAPGKLPKTDWTRCSPPTFSDTANRLFVWIEGRTFLVPLR